MVTLKETVAVMANDIVHIKENLIDIHTKIDKMNVRFDDLDSKYASKLTEKIVYGLCALILIAFVTKLTGLW